MELSVSSPHHNNRSEYAKLTCEKFINYKFQILLQRIRKNAFPFITIALQLRFGFLPFIKAIKTALPLSLHCYNLVPNSMLLYFLSQPCTKNTQLDIAFPRCVVLYSLVSNNLLSPSQDMLCCIVLCCIVLCCEVLYNLVSNNLLSPSQDVFC